MVAAAAAGFLVADFDGPALRIWLPRASITVAVVALFLIAHEIRMARQVARESADIKRQLAQVEYALATFMNDARYAMGYVDGLQRRPPGEGGGRHLRPVS